MSKFPFLITCVIFFPIALELVGPNYRSFVTVMTCLFYTLGLILLSGVTYLVRNWVNLALVTSLPFLVYFIYWWYVFGTNLFLPIFLFFLYYASVMLHYYLFFLASQVSTRVTTMAPCKRSSWRGLKSSGDPCSGESARASRELQAET